MRVRLKFVEREMAEPKKIRISFSENNVISLDDDDEDCARINLGACHSRSAAGTDAPAEEDTSEWREKVHNLKERNLMALKNSILTDITLEVGPENTPFKAHKLILALGSPVFEAMFYGPLAEQGEKVVIPDIMPDGFKVLLRYLYGDDTTLTNEIEALNAWIAADKYCVTKLNRDCNMFFCNCPVSSSNVWKLLESSVFLNLETLVSRCKQYLEKHTEVALQGEGFLETKAETVKQVLNISSANVSELFLFKCVIHWGKHKVNTGDAVSLTEVLRPLLPHIRFGALTPAEFCEFLDLTNDAMDQSDALAILKHLTQPLTYSLPEWCCKTTWQRGVCSVHKSNRNFHKSNRNLTHIVADSYQKRGKDGKLYRKYRSLPNRFGP